VANTNTFMQNPAPGEAFPLARDWRATGNSVEGECNSVMHGRNLPHHTRRKRQVRRWPRDSRQATLPRFTQLCFLDYLYFHVFAEQQPHDYGDSFMWTVTDSEPDHSPGERPSLTIQPAVLTGSKNSQNYTQSRSNVPGFTVLLYRLFPSQS
jgi:hypothetical protein